MKIAFLGAGRMARALIEGLLTTNSIHPADLIVTSPSGTSAKKLAEEFGVIVSSCNEEAIKSASTVILCMKPAQALAAVTAAQKNLTDKLIVSMVAGIRSEDLFQAAGKKARILRAMPNTAVRVQKGTIVFAPHSSATPEDFFLMQKFFSKCATIEKISEEKLDAVTALSGSGPAFALLFLEGLMEAGINAGLDFKLARSLAATTLEAAAALVLQTSQSPEELRNEIASPNGTTAAGLHVLKKENFQKIVGEAVAAARHRAQELALLN